MADETSTDDNTVVDPTDAASAVEEASRPPEATDDATPQGDADEIQAGEEDEQPVDLDAPQDDDSDQKDGGEGKDEDEDEVEMLDFAFGGNKLSIPKDSVPDELVGEIDKFAKGTWADYTRRTQENAETSKTLEARSVALETMTNLNGEVLDSYTKGLAVRQEIEQLSQVDMNALWQSNPDQARQYSDLLAAKQAEFSTIFNQVGQQETQLGEAQQAELGRQATEGRAILNRQIKNFSSEKAQEVVKYAIENGMDEETAKQWDQNPLVTRWAYESMLYRRMQTKGGRKGAAKSASAQAESVTPVKSIKSTGRAGATSSNPDKMSMDDLGKHLGLTP
jgi:hypothetical protein